MKSVKSTSSLQRAATIQPRAAIQAPPRKKIASQSSGFASSTPSEARPVSAGAVPSEHVQHKHVTIEEQVKTHDELLRLSGELSAMVSVLLWPTIF